MRIQRLEFAHHRRVAGGEEGGFEGFAGGAFGDDVEAGFGAGESADGRGGGLAGWGEAGGLQLRAGGGYGDWLGRSVYRRLRCTVIAVDRGT